MLIVDNTIKSLRIALIFIALLSLLLIAGCGDAITTFTPPAENTGPSITSYTYGEMVVDGKTYTSEVQIFPDGSVKDWPVQDPHYFVPKDFEEIVNSGIEILIIGTGSSGVAGFPEETTQFIKSKGITLHELNTHKAVELFNKSKKEKLAAVFHLNC